MPTAVTLLLILLDSRLSSQIEAAGLWLACTALFILSVFLSERLDEGLLSGYPNLAVMIGWFVLGLAPALGMAVAGVVLAALARRYLSPQRRHAPRDSLRQAAFGLLIPGAAVLAADGLYRLLGHSAPVYPITTAELMPLLAAQLGAFAAAHGASWLLVRLGLLERPPIPEAQQYRLLLAGAILLPLVVVLPLIFYSAGLTVFALSMIVIAAHVVRYHQVEQKAGETAQLAQRLSRIHESTRQIMHDLNQTSAVQVACQTALEITHGDKAAVLLLDDSGQTARLVESTGLSPSYRERMRAVPYPANGSQPGVNVVPDTAQLAPGSRMITPVDDREFRAFAELPLHRNGVPLGYLVVYHQQPYTYTDTELYLLNILANQVAAALDNAQLLQALEIHAFETSQLIHLSDLLGSSLEPDKLGRDIAAVLCQMFGMDYAAVGLLDSHTGRLRPLGDSTAPFLPLPAEIWQADRLSETALVVIQADEADGAVRQFMAAQNLATLLLLPLLHAETCFAVAALGALKSFRLDDQERRLLVAAGRQISARLYNALAHETTRKALDGRMGQLQQIERIVQQISSSQDFAEIIANVLTSAIQTTQSDMAALALLTEADDLWVMMHQHEGGQVQKSYLTQSRKEGVIGHVIRTGESALIADNRQIPYYLPEPDSTYLSSLAVPLVRDGEVIGVLEVESKQPAFFMQEQSTFLKNLAAHATISIQNARLVEELQYQVEILTHLRKLSLQLSTTVDTDSVAHTLLDTALAILEAQHAILFRHEENTGRLALLASRQLAAPVEGVVDTLRQSAYRAVETGELQVVENDLQHVGHPLSLLAMPILRGGSVREVLCLVFLEQQHFQPRDFTTLSLLTIQAAGHLENARLHEQIRDGNDRMSAILESARDGVILLDQHGNLVETNPSAERLLGINLGEHLGESYLSVLLQYADPDSQGYAGYSRAELERMRHTPWPEQDIITRRQFQRRTPQNQMIYIEETGSPVTGKQTQAAGRLLALRDITEQKQLEAYRDEITNMIIHNLRGPLSSIINGIRLARENIPGIGGYPIASQTLEMSVESARRLADMVSSLMDIARLEAQQLNLNFTDTDAGSLIQNACRDMLPSFQQASISVETVIPPDLPLVRVDGDKVHRVLINLLDNALRFTPRGGQIQISLTPERGRLLVRVADSGPGIPEAERDNIFKKYRQVQGSQPFHGHKGSGLGLTYCKLVIEAHGQTIWVETGSGPLPGACFNFTLPLA